MIWQILITSAVFVVVLEAAVYLFGSTHERRSTPAGFQAAQEAAFRSFGAPIRYPDT